MAGTNTNMYSRINFFLRGFILLDSVQRHIAIKTIITNVYSLHTLEETLEMVLLAAPKNDGRNVKLILNNIVQVSVTANATKNVWSGDDVLGRSQHGSVVRRAFGMREWISVFGSEHDE